MKKIILFLFFLVFGLNLTSQDLLTRIDDAFIPVKEFKVTLSIRDLKNGKERNPVVYTVYGKAPDNCILIVNKPPIMAGNSHLRKEDTIFMYTKKIDRMSKMSSKVAFSKTLFSQEDILNTMFSTLYDLESEERMEYSGKDALKVTLIGKTESVAYKKIVFYVDPLTLIPMAREYYSYSGKLIKRLTVDEINYEDNRLTYLKITMEDMVRTNRKSIAEFSDYLYQEVPDKYFTKSYMKILAR